MEHACAMKTRIMVFVIALIGIFATVEAFTVRHNIPLTYNKPIQAEHLRFQGRQCASNYTYLNRNCGVASVYKTALSMGTLDHSNGEADTAVDATSGTATTTTTTTTSVHAGIPKITTIKNRDDLINFLAEDDRLCVVKIYASWCKSCHKFGIKFRHYAQRHADLTDNKGKLVHKGQVRFAQIEYGANRILCKSFGIKKLPYVQLHQMSPESVKLSAASTSDESEYFISGQIDGFVCGPAKFDALVATRVDGMILSESDMEKLGDDEISFQKSMEDGQALANELMEQTSSPFLTMPDFSNGKNITARSV